MYYVECELVLRKIMLMTMFYMVLNCEGLLWESVTLCLPISLVPVMYPWVSGRDKVGIRALAQFMHFQC